jgi:hypothetical protein
MQLGMHLRELWRARLGGLLALLIAIFVGLSSTYDVGVLPPKLAPRSLDMAAASAHALVDTPNTSMLDLRQNTDDFTGLTDRAVLLGNVMASLPVRQYIARRAHVPANRIVAITPTTPLYPRPIADPQNTRKASDLLRSTDQYRISIQANPTVPVLDIYAQAPTPAAAAALANGAIAGLRDYLGDVARDQAVPADKQVQIEQLGQARGSIITGGVRLQASLLSFFITFVLCCGAVLFISRVVRGWRAAKAEESAEGTVGSPPADRDRSLVAV